MKRFLLLAWIASGLCSIAWGADKTATQKIAAMNAEKWRQDLEFYREQMPKVHGNLFHTMTREQFEQSIDQLERKLPQMSNAQVSTELLRLVAMVNDGHTRVRPVSLGFHSLPIRLYYFADGIHVEAGDTRYAEIIGGKIKKIGKLPIADAYAAVRPLIPVDRNNEFWRKLLAPWLLVSPEVLQSIGAIESRDMVKITVEKDGTEIAATLPAGPAQKWDLHYWATDPEGWINARAGAKNPSPLWLSHTDKNYWHEYLPDGKTLYIQYNAVQDQPGGEPITKYFPRLFKEAEERKVDRVILDMRLNGGGNNYLNRPIWHAMIKNERLNQNGKLWVIIGRNTFSAAMNGVDEIELNTNALFAGEPTGEPVNMWGDARPITLPNSGIVVQASTLWWQLEDPRDERDYRAPDLAAELTFADYAQNIDTVMNAIMKAGEMKSLPTQLRELAEKGDTKGIGPAAKAYFGDKRFRYVNVENPLNLLGYELLSEGKFEAAIEVFKVNTDQYPESWNTWDSLGEAYMKYGDKQRAIENYETSVRLNPQNTAAKDAIAKMKQ